jgi:hypothetical protein
MDHFNKKAGISILGFIILAVLVILALNYFHLSVKIVPDDSSGESSINHLGEVAKNIWASYLEKPLNDVWNNFILPFISSIKNGSFGKLQNMMPQPNFGQ